MSEKLDGEKRFNYAQSDGDMERAAQRTERTRHAKERKASKFREFRRCERQKGPARAARVARQLSADIAFEQVDNSTS